MLSKRGFGVMKSHEKKFCRISPWQSNPQNHFLTAVEKSAT
jgi:hypothetical protein